MKRIPLLSVAFGLALAATASASTWSGGNASWSSDATPGWNGTGVPNAQGAVALFENIATAKVTQDIAGGVTVGRFLREGSASGDLSLAAGSGVSAGIIFDQDGAGPDYAVISNATTRRISLGNLAYTMNDDLLIVNTVPGNSANTFCISISGAVGGSGNLTLDNIVNLPGANAISLSGSGSFTGNVIIRRGGVRIANKGFGAGTNPVFLGQDGAGSATMAMYGSSLSLGHPITLAAAPNGSLSIVSFIDSGTTKNWSHILRGAISLGSTLVVESPVHENWSGSLDLKGVLSGAGGLTKVGPGVVNLFVANTYSGVTSVEEGSLCLTSAASLGTGDVSIAPGALLSIANSASIADTATLTFGAGATPGKLDLAAGVNETVKSFYIGTSWQKNGTYGATGSGAKYIRDDLFSGTGVLTVLEGSSSGTVFLFR